MDDIRVGFDLGDVVIDVAAWKRMDPAVPFRHAPEMAGAIDVMAQIVRASPERTQKAAVISKVQDPSETLEWIEEHDFFGRTSILAGRVHFCRYHRAKAEIAYELGLTHFFDNKLEVLRPMLGIVPHLYHFGVPTTEEGFYPMRTWWDAPRELL